MIIATNTKLRRIVALVFGAALPLVCVAEESVDLQDKYGPACTRPPVGLVQGACEARVASDIDKSPYALHKWVECLQEGRHWGTGGKPDAIFFTELIPEWEKEISANLLALSPRLSTMDRQRLLAEQRSWERARARNLKKMSDGPHQVGSMYRVIESVQALNLPERRALELACRIEKFSARE